MGKAINEINRIPDEADKFREKLPARSMEVAFNRIVDGYEKVIEELLLDSNYTGK